MPAVSHLVLTVRDIEASHRFFTEVLGFEQCGQFESPVFSDVDMRFYRGAPDRHHDLALVQSNDVESQPPRTDFDMFGPRVGLNHLAITYGDRETWLAQLKKLKDLGVRVIIRGNHGMTHSAYIQDPDGHGIEVLYDLPNEVWEGDLNAALSYFELLPNDSLEDSTDYKRFSTSSTSA
jgi:catechol 2,3-dioxygenase